MHAADEMDKENGALTPTNAPLDVANPTLDLQAMEIFKSENLKLVNQNKSLEDENTRVRIRAVQMENQLASGLKHLFSKKTRISILYLLRTWRSYR